MRRRGRGARSRGLSAIRLFGFREKSCTKRPGRQANIDGAAKGGLCRADGQTGRNQRSRCPRSLISLTSRACLQDLHHRFDSGRRLQELSCKAASSARVTGQSFGRCRHPRRQSHRAASTDGQNSCNMWCPDRLRAPILLPTLAAAETVLSYLLCDRWSSRVPGDLDDRLLGVIARCDSCSRRRGGKLRRQARPEELRYVTEALTLRQGSLAAAKRHSTASGASRAASRCRSRPRPRRSVPSPATGRRAGRAHARSC